MNSGLSNSGQPGPSSRKHDTNVPPSAAFSYSCDLEEKIVDLASPIQEKAQSIRLMHPVNWTPYLSAELIDEREHSFITVFQMTRTKEARDKILDDYQEDAFKTFVKLLQRVYTVDDIQRVLVLIDDLFWEDLSRVHLFKEAVTDPWEAFTNLLSCSDEFVRNLTSRIITKFLVILEDKPSTSYAEYFLDWLKKELRRDNAYILSVARCLQKLLGIDQYRTVFFHLNGIFKVIRMLCSGIKLQAQYQLVFCIWVSSYNFEIVESLNNYGVIQVFVELLESCSAEVVKLPRVILATFRNLLEKPRQPGVRKHHALIMIQSKLFKFLSVLKIRMKNFDDTEFLDDFDAIEVILDKFVAELSTFDKYKLEVKSGHLEWSVVHTSKLFWDANAHRLNENDYELLKKLVSLLKMSRENSVLRVAAHDLGEYMSRYPRGRTLVEQFGGKDALLKLLNSENSSVKYYALKSLQILMMNNYDLLVDFVGKGKLTDSFKKKE